MQSRDDYDFDDELDELDELEPLEEGEGIGNWPIVVALVFAAALIGYVVMDGLESQTYFYEVDQAVAQGEDLVGQTVRVKGEVEAGSVVGESGQLGRSFKVAAKGKSLDVRYEKALPDTFKDGVEVVIQGDVDDSYVLQADEVMVKCPSRYEGAPPTAHQEGDSPQAAR
ncbi:MAG: cytochrome c maturation protein CcmE [Myxococcota bacterium]